CKITIQPIAIHYPFPETETMKVAPTHPTTEVTCLLARLGDGTFFAYRGQLLKKRYQADSFTVVCSYNGREVHFAPWTQIAGCKSRSMADPSSSAMLARQANSPTMAAA